MAALWLSVGHGGAQTPYGHNTWVARCSFALLCYAIWIVINIIQFWKDPNKPTEDGQQLHFGIGTNVRNGASVPTAANMELNNRPPNDGMLNVYNIMCIPQESRIPRQDYVKQQEN